MLVPVLFAIGAGGLAYGISKLPDEEPGGSGSSSGAPPKEGDGVETPQAAYARGFEESKQKTGKEVDKRADSKAKGLFDSWKADFLEKQLKGDSDGS